MVFARALGWLRSLEDGLEERLGLGMYRSSYVDSVLAGLASDGSTWAITVGRHGPGYPYDDPQSEWDDLIVDLGGVRCGLSARRIDSLTIERDPQVDGRVKILFDGSLTDGEGAGAAHDVAFELHFAVVAGEAREMGRPFPIPAGLPSPGMRWQPFQLRLDAALSQARVDGKEIPLRRGSGEWEEGALENLRARAFAFRYDYACLVDPAGDRYWVAVTTHALTTDSPITRALDWYARATASAEITVEDGRFVDGNPRGVPQPSDVIHTNLVDLGLARLERQLVRATGSDGSTWIGLREIFHPTDAA